MENLSPQERLIYSDLMGEDPYKLIARRHGVAEGTIGAIASHIYAKLRVNGRKELIKAYGEMNPARREERLFELLERGVRALETIASVLQSG